MRSLLALVLLAALTWGGMPLVHQFVDGKGGAALAKNGSSGGNHDDGGDGDDDDDGDNDDDGGGSGSSGSSSGGATAASRGDEHFGRDGISVRFADGHVERISEGRFESLDAGGGVVASHAAHRSDVERLRTIGERAKRRGGSEDIQAVVEIGDKGSAIDVTDNRGWREIVSRSTYAVKDPAGRTVIHRPATLDDVMRIRGVLGLD